ncbi:MAG: DUF4199 domain-containing protein [Bacteroidota bacterium]
MKQRITELKWGFIFTISLLVWMVLERMVGLHDQHIDKHVIYTNFWAIPAIAIYVLALLEKRKKDLDGTMSYSEGFISGLVITFVVTILVPLNQYIISYVITPDYFNNVIAYSVQNDIMTREEAEAQFNFLNYMKQGLIGAPIMGIITSGIVAIFTRSKS